MPSVEPRVPLVAPRAPSPRAPSSTAPAPSGESPKYPPPSRVHCAVDSRPNVIFLIDRADVVTMPPTARNAETNIVRLCPSYLASGGSSCSAFPVCHLAHARLRQRVPTLRPHVLASARKAAALTAIRKGGAVIQLQPEQPPHSHPRTKLHVSSHTPNSPPTPDSPSTRPTVIMVRLPNTSVALPMDPIDSVPTRSPVIRVAFEGFVPPAPLSHCAHWLQKHVCHFGANCRFVHALDPPPHPSPTFPTTDSGSQSRSPIPHTQSPATVAADDSPSGESDRPRQTPAPDQMLRPTRRRDPYMATPTIRQPTSS